MKNERTECRTGVCDGFFRDHFQHDLDLLPDLFRLLHTETVKFHGVAMLAGQAGGKFRQKTEIRKNRKKVSIWAV